MQESDQPALKQIAMVLLFDRRNRLLIYLRDNKPEIPFPDHWDFFGGHVEEGETPEETLIREVKEELGFELTDWKFFRTYVCLKGDAYPNVKYIYWARLEKNPQELTLYEGQMLRSLTQDERANVRFANVLGAILEDFIAAGLWPRPVDNLPS